MGITVINQQDIPLAAELERILVDLVQRAAADHDVSIEEVNIVFVDGPTIQELNQRFRGQPRPTDVLSFPLEPNPLVGEIIINVARAQEQAGAYGHSLQRELAYLTTHGIFHLLGYDHETPAEKEAMRQREEELLAAFQLSRDD
ncbi:MAG: rRNA maturation RNase YbeY [Limnochordia bacterium]